MNGVKSPTFGRTYSRLLNTRPCQSWVVAHIVRTTCVLERFGP